MIFLGYLVFSYVYNWKKLKQKTQFIEYNIIYYGRRQEKEGKTAKNPAQHQD
jgi:hypothetical protein